MVLVRTESRRPTISFHKIPTFIAYFLVGFGMKRASAKEPVGKKNSGLGKLMSVLHQNAASLVTTRTAHNGPDQVKGGSESERKSLTQLYPPGSARWDRTDHVSEEPSRQTETRHNWTW